MAEVWFEQKAGRLARSTRDGYRSSLDQIHIPRFGGRKIASIDADVYATLVRDLEREGLHAVDPKRPKRPLSPASIERYMVPLQQVLAFAARRSLIPSDPLQNLTRDDRPAQADSEPAHEWSDEEVGALVTASEELAARPESRYDYSVLIKTAVYTGLRQSELLGLRWEAVDLDDAVLHVRQQWARSRELTAPKTKAGVRRVPLAPHVVTMLRKHKLASKFSTDGDYVFASKTGKPLEHRNVSRRGFEAARDKAGLNPSLSLHDLRHAFASMAAHRGVPVDVLSATMGHGDIAVTLKVYTHLFNRRRAEDAFRAAMGGA